MAANNIQSSRRLQKRLLLGLLQCRQLYCDGLESLRMVSNEMEKSMSKFLVTGGLGLIGHNVVERLEAPFEATVKQ